jgi:hypothetical protein
MIRIFVGTSANDEDLEAQAVFEYSLRKHHPADDIDLTWMRLSRDPSSFWYSNPEKNEGWTTKTWATPFSALRWGIPAACNYQGKAIYTDCDMIVMDDITKLWNQEFQPGKVVIAKGDGITFCTMLMDCGGLQSVLPPINEIKCVPGRYRDIRRTMNNPKYVQKFDGNWNCRDGEKYETIFDPDVKILHYTTIPTQPTHKHAKARLAAEGRPHWFAGQSRPHPREEVQELFDDMLADATAHGFAVDRYRTEPFGDYRR